MHQAFTGSARKSRQVNLSGRANANPWANLSGPTKSSHGAPVGHATVAHAQAERQQRQHERERLNASKKVQKTWRGHRCRRETKAQWRQEWDKTEQDRLDGSTGVDYIAASEHPSRIPAYTQPGILLSQLRLLVHFQEFRRGISRHDSDLYRVLYFGAAIQQSSSFFQTVKLDHTAVLNLARLGRYAVRHIRSIKLSKFDARSDRAIVQLSGLIIFLSNLIPQQMNNDAQLYMEVLREILGPDNSARIQSASVDTILTILFTSIPESPEPYISLVSVLLSDDLLATNPDILRQIASKIDHLFLAQAMHSLSLDLQNKRSSGTNPADDSLWQVSYLIWMYRHFRESSTKDTEPSFIQALSSLLNCCANAIAQRFELEDIQMGKDVLDGPQPLPQFVKDSISYISQQKFVRSSISILTQNSGPDSNDRDSDLIAARNLADYAVSMLRAFPSKASDIRMWMYQGSITLSTGRSVSAVQFFWTTASRTQVFAKITQSHRNVMSILTEAAPQSHQIGQAAVSNAQIQKWKEDWRIILLFLELYTFILKIMDDDEFFYSKDVELQAPVGIEASGFKRGALPLNEIATLTTFLKNLAFVLYWNAADFAASNSVDQENIAALFGAPELRPSPLKVVDKAPAQTLAGNGVSQAYLKDLTTGLLRMIHERDSRRNFLPKDHWLMTNQVDMTGFIPSVVAEEEKRHELGEDEEDEEDDIDAFDQYNQRDAFAVPQLSSAFGIRQPHTPRSLASQQAARMERQRAQMRKKLLVQSLAPRLEILRNLPFFIPFETRVQIFRQFVYRDQVRRRNGAVEPDAWRMQVAHTTQGRDVDGRPLAIDVIGRQHAQIHRDSVFEDAYSSFYPLGEGLKEPIQISFIDKFGAPEAGIDGGGVTKEFLMSVTSEALDPKNDLSMFQENEQRYLYPNPVILEETTEKLRRMGIRKGTEEFNYNIREFMRRYEFLGRVIGKCLYEGILIDVNFAGFFLLKWALTGGSTTATTETAYRASINDLRDYDEQLYQGLLKLKNYTGDVESDFALNFTINDEILVADQNGQEITQTVTHDLIPNGSNTPITSLNRYLYIDRIVRYRLQQQPALVTNAFLRGLGQIIQPMWLAMFNQKELQKLIGGDNTELDIADLRRNTTYGGLYVIGDDGLEHPTVELFWKVMREMNDEDRRKVLKFVTSTPRAPLLGFSHLNPQFSIRDSSEDQDRLPSTSTCMNLLKLPRYGDKQTMREKLLYAVNAGAGFDLS